MDKHKLVASILKQLNEELEIVTRSAESAREAATHSESKAEDHHDTRGLEASYLAGAQASRAAELQRMITIYKFLYFPEFNPGDLIGPGALVQLELSGHHSFYFLVPQGGGLTLQMDGKPIRVITPMAPLGEALLGRTVGDTVEIEGAGGSRIYRIVSIS